PAGPEGPQGPTGPQGDPGGLADAPLDHLIMVDANDEESYKIKLIDGQFTVVEQVTGAVAVNQLVFMDGALSNQKCVVKLVNGQLT
ncbi:hypothetical protein, partial [Streptococcus pseudopneumoniae]|uniref:hypothetical protein n=1 Tax=Streptococcus pseudopneumoniae TaxID=257758 RepID=UPI0019D66826